ncbi:MAG TPA: bifunctional transaldolase/phosoglucose isomerase [Terriglobia bacterium]|nr:bifunctional transaldolase/phosoglucose isomerase [Terriglobia bacterium]
MSENPLKELQKFGQSVWHDYIRRQEILSGGLKRRIDEDGLLGVTSNPSIFEKAIAGSNDYDDGIRQFVSEGLEAAQIYEKLAVEDIQSATDVFRPVYDATGGRDGYVSLEVSPLLAHDTKASLEEARRLFRAVNRPNVMIKIPGTKEGLPAIEQALSEGININITLLFGIERYEEVAKIYLKALEKRAAEGKPVDRVASVASVFVSRIDSLLDPQLEATLNDAKTPEERKKIESLIGKVAVANTKLIYQKYKEIFGDSRFETLAKMGARVQRPLWGSTSTKNPKYNDVLYVEDLIGLDTVNTMPTNTMDAFRDHGKARATIEEGLDEARRVVSQLAEEGINLRAVTQQLEDQGVEAFARDYKTLIASIEEKKKKILGAAAGRALTVPGSLSKSVQNTLAKLEEQKFSKRLWERDASLWKSEPEPQKIIRNALGWLTIAREMRGRQDSLIAFAKEAQQAGFRHAVLLGMGGSSLCPDVLRATFGTAPGYLNLQVLDSTVPANIARVEKSIDLAKTLFLVSSKSGGTTETLSFYKYFYEQVRKVKGGKAGENFVAITDPGTGLEKLAKERNFRHVFPGAPDIGGRYSALSNFGIVPAALIGLDIKDVLDRAERMMEACGPGAALRDNPGVILGVILAEAARAGRDKVTLVISPAVETFADWAEQLIAESTGKEGKGLVPVAGEALGEPANYANDRVFVRLRLASDSDDATAQKLQALEEAGHPVIRIELESKLDLAQEFFRWEVATATAGALLGINAFDQPNVQESKDNTKRLLEQVRSKGKLPAESAVLVSDGLEFYCDAETHAAIEKRTKGGNSAEGLLAGFFEQARPGDYAALMAYLERTPEIESQLQSLRLELRNALRAATSLGFGPRFLHSTGQLHKGGPNTGLFLQITAADSQDLAIPGEPYTFSVLKQAQALGDLQSLESKKRRVLRVHLAEKTPAGLERLSKALEAAVAKARATSASQS